MGSRSIQWNHDNFSKTISTFLYRLIVFFIVNLILLGRGQFTVPGVHAADGVVEVILYWEAGCPACEKVLEETIPALQEMYPGSFRVNLIEVSDVEDIDALYRLGTAYGLPKEEIGVPMLLIGDIILVGSDQIPQELPVLVNDYLKRGGITTTAPALQTAPQRNFQVDEPVWSGIPLAWGLLVLMAAALIYTGWKVSRAFQGYSMQPLPAKLEWVIPALALVGIAVAGYLTYIEMTYTPAVCGPVGNCNAVQNSPYARIFGFIPVGLFGVVGYLGIIVAWYWHRVRPEGFGTYMPVAVLGMTVFGTLYSVYLTYLEIFVIKAVCIWCLSSALIITLLMLAALPAAANWLAIAEEEE